MSIFASGSFSSRLMRSSLWSPPGLSRGSLLTNTATRWENASSRPSFTTIPSAASSAM